MPTSLYLEKKRGVTPSEDLHMLLSLKV